MNVLTKKNRYNNFILTFMNSAINILKTIYVHINVLYSSRNS